MIKISKLPPEEWKKLRDLRLEALQSDPLAFVNSYEEERLLKPEEWKKRVDNTLVAFSKDTAIGMIVYIIDSKIKARHIARLYGVYVRKKDRGQGVGKKLVQGALKGIQQNPNISKIHLTVNAEQTVAVALYKQFGFELTGILKKELQFDGKFYDELILEKYLKR
jgi:ribosomal protein S18 acetylase RimI-like enzyme